MSEKGYFGLLFLLTLQAYKVNILSGTYRVKKVYSCK